MFYKCILFLLFSGAIETLRVAPTCPYPHIDNGRVQFRGRQRRTRLVKFMCSYRYELVGNRYGTCRNGEWDVPMPVCVRPGCPELPPIQHAVQYKSHHDAWVETFCFPQFKLIGSPTMYCDGNRWNATIPRCVNATSMAQNLSCDFESEDLCGWRQDELHDFDWERINKKTPSSFLQTGPSYDHTLGKGNNGHYMYIESTSKLVNDTARLISPIFEAHLAVDGCFSFFYHMYGRSIGGLRVYQKPDKVSMADLLNMTIAERAPYILFEQWGDLGDFWYSAASQLKDFEDYFQIIIEGIRGKSFTSDIAIDDVAILQGINCEYFRNAGTTPTTPVYSDSCVGRCDVNSTNVSTANCACSPSCLLFGICCPDYLEACAFAGNSTDDDVSELPQTEKLVSVSTPLSTSSTTTTTTTTTTTEAPTTTTTRKPTSQFVQTSPKSTRRTSVQPVTFTTTERTTTRPTRTTRLTTTPTTIKTTKKLTPSTTARLETTSKKITTKLSTTTKTNSSTYVTVSTTIDYKKEEENKRKKEVNLQKLQATPIKQESSSWKTAVVTIVVLAVVAGLAYLGLTARGSKAREALARLRGLASHDSEVRYLTSNDDDL